MADDPTVSNVVSKIMSSPGGAGGPAPAPPGVTPPAVPVPVAPPAPLKSTVPADPPVVPPVAAPAVPPVVAPVVPPVAAPVDPYANVPAALAAPAVPVVDPTDFNVAAIDVSMLGEDVQLNWGKARAKIERQDVLIAEDVRTRAALTAEVEAPKTAGGNVQ